MAFAKGVAKPARPNVTPFRRAYPRLTRFQSRDDQQRTVTRFPARVPAIAANVGSSRLRLVSSARRGSRNRVVPGTCSTARRARRCSRSLPRSRSASARADIARSPVRSAFACRACQRPKSAHISLAASEIRASDRDGGGPTIEVKSIRQSAYVPAAAKFSTNSSTLSVHAASARAEAVSGARSPPRPPQPAAISAAASATSVSVRLAPIGRFSRGRRKSATTRARSYESELPHP